VTAVTVTDRSALASALRQLKLSGMLATLDARLAQAHAGELGHLDFLQVLCQDEVSRRESMSLARRIRRARFESEATLEGFDFTASPKLPAAQIRDLAALRWLASGESVILYGPVGRIAAARQRSHRRAKLFDGQPTQRVLKRFVRGSVS
jgi:DNA replication protein DnaC